MSPQNAVSEHCVEAEIKNKLPVHVINIRPWFGNGLEM